MRALDGWEWLADRHDGGLLRFGAGPAEVARVAHGRMVYLATPYSKRVLDARGLWDSHLSMICALAAADEGAGLLRVGVTAVSPIAQAHLMVQACGDGPHRIDPMDPALWARWCAPMLAACAAVYVPDLAGWSESTGILHEVRTAVAACKPVFIEAFVLPPVVA